MCCYIAYALSYVLGSLHYNVLGVLVESVLNESVPTSVLLSPQNSYAFTGDIIDQLGLYGCDMESFLPVCVYLCVVILVSMGLLRNQCTSEQKQLFDTSVDIVYSGCMSLPISHCYLTTHSMLPIPFVCCGLSSLSSCGYVDTGWLYVCSYTFPHMLIKPMEHKAMI